MNDGGRIYVEECYNERTSERLTWPPQGAVSQTAVAYFDSDGNPTHPLHDVPLQLAAADAIGDVRGLPEEPSIPRDHARVSGSIVLHTPSTIADITGPVQRSVTGLVTGLAPESHTTPTAAIDDAGTPRLTASIVLRAVEVRGPTHAQLSEALGDPGLLRIDSDDLTVRCRVQYRIFDSGNIQTTIIYADPVVNHPNFDTVRRMIDAALQDRFPDKTIEIGEAYDYGDRTDFVDRELPPRDMPGAEQMYRTREPGNGPVRNTSESPSGGGVGTGSSEEAPARGDHEIDHTQSHPDAAVDAVDTPSQSDLADEALARRVPPVEATELVHPIGDEQLAVERAQANAAWWKGLNEGQRRALIETYPVQIGNAEGFRPFAVSPTRSLEDSMRYGDQLQAQLDRGSLGLG